MASNDDWRKEINALFRMLNDYCKIALTTGCSMHIHVSPSAKPKGSQDKWTYLHLRNIMKAISYFDQPITQIMPAERKENPYCMSNMMSEDITKKSPYKLNEAYLGIALGKPWKGLFDIYDRALKNAVLRSQAHPIMGQIRVASWNFEHITDECGTVEFRRCPGVNNPEKAIHWVAFTLGFMYAAALQEDAKYKTDWTKLAAKTAHPSVHELSTFVQYGIAGLESTCQTALQPIAEDKAPKKVWTAREWQAALLKKSKDEKLPSPYADKVIATPKGTPTGSPANSRASTPK